MWQRIIRSGERISAAGSEAPTGSRDSRRAYYRIQAWVPVRIAKLAADAVEAAVYDLSMPDPLAVPFPNGSALEGPERSALLARLRRIEEKLDLLLEARAVDVPRPLSGRDRRSIVFSGGGLALDVDFDFARGDAFRVELLLPAPHARIVRAVAEAVEGAGPFLAESGKRRLGLAFRHIEPAERDALVAYGYDLQRIALRAKHDGAGARP